MIYIHIPFCKSFCTYCDFYSEICSQKVQKLFVDELCKEIGERRAEIESTLGLNTLYIGGGTPSVLEPELLKRIVDTLGYGPYREFTVEVNPDDITLHANPGEKIALVGSTGAGLSMTMCSGG